MVVRLRLLGVLGALLLAPRPGLAHEAPRVADREAHLVPGGL
jgi:hypothetical protein